MNTRPCPLIVKALEKYAMNAYEDRPHGLAPEKCIVVAASPVSDFVASLSFSHGKLEETDIPTDSEGVQNVRALLEDKAKSCRLKDIHYHEIDQEGGFVLRQEASDWRKAERFDLHLSDCDIRDLGKVLIAAGYNE